MKIEKRQKFILVAFDNFSKNGWETPLQNRNSPSITNEFLLKYSQTYLKQILIETYGGNNLRQIFSKIY